MIVTFKICTNFVSYILWFIVIMKQYVNKRQGMLMKLYAIFEYYVGFYETNSFSVKFFMSVFFIVHPLISFGHLVLNLHRWCKVQSCTYVKYNNSH